MKKLPPHKAAIAAVTAPRNLYRYLRLSLPLLLPSSQPPFASSVNLCFGRLVMHVAMKELMEVIEYRRFKGGDKCGSKDRDRQDIMSTNRSDEVY